MTIGAVHPISRARISTGGTGARNYDEFADEAEITDIVLANPDSALAIEMPHWAPDSLGKGFAAALPAAAARLTRQYGEGRYTPAHDVFALYRISDPDKPEQAALGLFAMADTDQISTSVEDPGLIIRNEDVFIDKVRERVALANATGHLLSPVLLLATGRGDQLHAALAAAVAEADEPDVTNVDHVGRVHAVWTLPVGSSSAAHLAELAGTGELVVADGNHRSLAAQIGGLSRFLAVITTPASVAIAPYHRLISACPVDLEDLVARLASLGIDSYPGYGPPDVPMRGSVQVYARGGSRVLRLPAPATSSTVDDMDHAVVERILLGAALGMEPGDKRVTYVGGDYPPSWLIGEVDAGRADLAVLIAPVSVDDFIAVNLARQKLPRKSTWFTPKARAGLVLAEIADPDRATMAQMTAG